MATWIEFRCENRGSGFRSNDPRRCWSDTNAGPMQMAADDNESIMATLRFLRAQAKETGWKRTTEGWVCPACLKNQQAKGEKA